MLTADTITDEQIRELRASAVGAAFVDAGEEVLGGDETLSLCDEALGELDYGMNSTLRMMPAEWFRWRKQDARARCAEILNARAKESK